MYKLKMILIVGLLFITNCSSNTTTSTVSDDDPQGEADDLYRVNILLEPEIGGKVYPSTDSLYEKNLTITFTAAPNRGYIFNEWSGDIDADENEIDILIDKDYELKSKFTSWKSLYKDGYWLNTYGGEESDVAYSITNSSDGLGYVIVGLRGERFEVFKIDTNGKVVWSNFYNEHSLPERGDHHNFQKMKIKATNDNGYIVSGFNQYGDNAADTNAYFLKISATGEKEWEKSVGGSSKDWASSIYQTKDGSYLATGIAQSNDGDFEGYYDQGVDIFIIKLSKNGDTQWTKIIGGTKQDRVEDVVETDTGNILLTGRTSSNDDYFSDRSSDVEQAFTVMLDSEGNKIWSKFYRPDVLVKGNKIIKLLKDEFLIVGRQLNDISNSNIGLIKINNVGQVIWKKVYGGESSEWVHDATITKSEDIIFTGLSLSTNFEGLEGSRDNILVFKTGSEGILKWIKTFQGGAPVESYSVAVDNNDNIILSGASKGSINDFENKRIGSWDYFILKLDSGGNLYKE